MEQHVVACGGNIYTNEALFEADINHKSTTINLSTFFESINVLAALVRAIKAVLLIYGRSGKTCRKCNRPIIDYLLSHRRTYQCLMCQR
ncbi:hypothetical protein [Candidatus Coxiella mudrowiae]|uniref:hypothetical protein n=1 Tax=Candidatus Coxiella mudrowiae TaxID=2054173 RepID=UPI000C288917